MRFGLILPSFSFPDLDYAKAARLRDFAQRAEAQGFEALWVVEHLLTARGLYGTAWLSPLETLSFAAGCTTNIKLATGILIAALFSPRRTSPACNICRADASNSASGSAGTRMNTRSPGCRCGSAVTAPTRSCRFSSGYGPGSR